ncbi:hypothetical protein LEP48_04330 [Isoptericola sp. NEAU-Y5]|uniref:Aromatic ring-opening dioxygenase LigA n=1 Tax=Isoptericola luteus TaxID=2879484 RepID=A0ABS7ZE67_9MICO|nr:hypothetical protein [Isoptericola sp. NEAU-Y5]MCA5892581.1 hypothetical protein [Isoptericola sp. NEAU-Y5]
MSSTVTIQPTRGVRGIGLFSIIAGIVLIIAGVVVWAVVAMTLSNENITVADDSTLLGGMFAGQSVTGPLTAYAQADVIDMHAKEMAGGQTYAELPQDDPLRASVMNASFLRASLFTSVVAFGVCALVVGIGLLFILVGVALRKLAGGPQVSVEGPGLSSQGDLSTAPRHADTTATPNGPAEPTPPPPSRTSYRTAEAPAPETRTPSTTAMPARTTDTPTTRTPAPEQPTQADPDASAPGSTRSPETGPTA